MLFPRHLPSTWRLILLAAAPVLFAAIPAAVLENGPSLCVWKVLLSVDCWGCGMTRALHRLLLGDWQTALEFNPRVFPVFLLLGAEWVRRIHRQISAIRGNAGVACGN